MNKKIFTLLSICMVAGILFASCGTHFTLKKRHYSSGYYFSGGKVNAGESDADESKGTSVDQSRDYSDKLLVKSNEDKSEIKSVPESMSQEIIQSDKIESNVKMDNDVPADSELKNADSNDDNSEILPAKLHKNKLHKNGMKHDGDGLSLFWIVILVILILWAIGFIGGSVGALINLLLLVALILLILWLLRVI